MLQEAEKRTMENWEYRIKEYPYLYLDRITVSCIKRYILRSLENFAEWDRLFEQVEKDISKL